MSEPQESDVRAVLSSEMERRGHRLLSGGTVHLGSADCGGVIIGVEVVALGDVAQPTPVRSGSTFYVVDDAGFHVERDAVLPSGFSALEEAFAATRAHFGIPMGAPPCRCRLGSPT